MRGVEETVIRIFYKRKITYFQQKKGHIKLGGKSGGGIQRRTRVKVVEIDLIKAQYMHVRSS